jgi:hypothetical protein
VPLDLSSNGCLLMGDPNPANPEVLRSRTTNYSHFNRYSPLVLRRSGDLEILVAIADIGLACHGSPSRIRSESLAREDLVGRSGPYVLKDVAAVVERDITSLLADIFGPQHHAIQCDLDGL